MVRCVARAKLFGEPVDYGTDWAIVPVARGLQVFDACEGGPLIESLLVAAALVILAVLLCFGVREAWRPMDHRVLVVHRVLREVRAL